VKENALKLPFFARASILIMGVLALIVIMYAARGIIVPIVFAVMIAIVLNPVVNFFVRRKIHRLLAIFITLSLCLIIIAGLCTLLFSQVSQLAESWPALVEKFAELLSKIINWVSDYFGVNPVIISEWVENIRGELLNTSTAFIGKTIVNAGNIMFLVFLVPVYTFFILFYQPLLISFTHKLFSESKQIKVNEIITQSKSVIQRYLIGLVIEFVLVAILNSTVLLILGIDYAILLGITGALLNMIPYIGGIVGTALPMMVALVTKDSAWYALYIFAAYSVVQVIDNNFIVPKIVSSKVKINALISIVAIIVGGALWGIAGMFLFIPIVAILKLILDRTTSFKPWGEVLGDTMPPLLKIKTVFKRSLTKSA
jgi:predicted PurR-regulated permease PerM